MNNIITYRETLSTYGLNKYRNFLVKQYVCLNNENELGEWAAKQIQDHGCPESAIFAIGYDLDMYAMVSYINEETDELVIDQIKFGWNMDIFAELDSEFRFCCYGLIEEIKPGIWKVLEE